MLGVLQLLKPRTDLPGQEDKEEPPQPAAMVQEKEDLPKSSIVKVKGAITLKPPVIFGITQRIIPLDDTPTEAGIGGVCHLVKLLRLHPMTDTRKQ